MSRCLIYKVHTARAAGFYLTTSQNLCQELFSDFFNLFCSLIQSLRRGLLLPQRFYMLPHFPAFVKNFFRLFSKSFVLYLGRRLATLVLADSFDRLPHLSSLVNPFFQVFFRFFKKPLFPRISPLFPPPKSPAHGHFSTGFPLAERQRVC